MSDTTAPTTVSTTTATKVAATKSATKTPKKAATKKAASKKSPAKKTPAKKTPAKKAQAQQPVARVVAPAPTGFDAKVVEAVREAATSSLELGMKALHVAEQRRDALFSDVTARLDGAKTKVEELIAVLEARLAELDQRVEAFEVRLDQQVARIEDRLPAQAAQFVGQAHHLAKGARTRVRHLGRAAG